MRSSMTFCLSHKRMNWCHTLCEAVKNGKPSGLLLSDMVTFCVDAITSITLPHAERNPDK